MLRTADRHFRRGKREFEARLIEASKAISLAGSRDIVDPGHP
jgi:hypothetical protein